MPVHMTGINYCRFAQCVAWRLDVSSNHTKREFSFSIYVVRQHGESTAHNVHWQASTLILISLNHEAQSYMYNVRLLLLWLAA